MTYRFQMDTDNHPGCKYIPDVPTPIWARIGVNAGLSASDFSWTNGKPIYAETSADSKYAPAVFSIGLLPCVVNTAIYEFLQQHNQCSFVPVDVKSSDSVQLKYHLITQCPVLKDVIDYEKSDINAAGVLSSRIKSIAAVKAKVAAGLHWWALDGHMSGERFCSDELRELIELSTVAGIVFFENTQDV